VRDLKEALHLGVLGNFAINHQGNLKSYKSSNGTATGLVPTYVPFKDKNESSPLAIYPISHTKLQIPSTYDNVQIEPEIVLDCDIKYYNGNVLYIIPKRFTIYNDASLNRLSSNRVSENKNWGANSKGIASKWIEIDRFDGNSNLSLYNFVSFVKRDGVIQQYSIDTSVNNYSLLYENLIEWIIKQIKNQKDALSLENISSIIEKAGNPEKALINIGTSLFTNVGERTFLNDGDEIFVVLYDRTKYREESIKAYLLAYKTRNVNYDGMVILHQTAYLSNS
jgi:hypothetical protein